MAQVKISAPNQQAGMPNGGTVRVYSMEIHPDDPAGEQKCVLDICEWDPASLPNQRLRDILKYAVAQLNDPAVAEISIVKGA